MMMESNSDRISNLSTDITDIILSKLSIKEAARTSILSKKWRSKWVSLPILTISDWVFKRQFINVVNQILIQHSGSIRVFNLDLDVLDGESCMNIEHWIRYLSMKGLTEFSLQFFRPHGYKLNSGLSHFQTLVTLKLQFCHIEIPLGFLGFNCLINLELNYMTFEDGALAVLTEKCPVLKYLSLAETQHDDVHLNIMAPNLEFFVFEGRSPKRISFKSKSLVHASIGFCKWLHSLPRAHVFSVEGSGNNIMNTWEALKSEPCILSNIQHLHLDEFNIQHLVTWSSAVNLIANSPNLAVLSIYLVKESSSDRYRVGYVGKLSDVEKRSLCTSKLKNVEIHGFEGQGCVMEIVELLLSKSPLLERIVIQANVSLNIYHSHHILKQLTRFRRAAPNVQLIYLDAEDIYTSGSMFYFLKPT